MGSNPLVSVVIPTYNDGDRVVRAIESALAQTYGATEIIVVDDGSTDGTMERLTAYGTRIQLVRQANRGQGAARNAGVTASRGHLIAFLDSDDAWHPSKLERQCAHFPASGVAVIATQAWMVSAARRAAPTPLGRGPFTDFGYDEVLRRNRVITSSVLVERVLFDEFGGFDEAQELRCNEDYDLWLRLSRRGRIRILHEPLVEYAVREQMTRRQLLEIGRGLAVIDKHVTLGYLRDRRVVDDARAATNMAMGLRALRCDRAFSRARFRDALRQTSAPRERIRAVAGYVSSFLPNPVFDLGHALLNVIRR